jgi:N-acetylneuraminic acid mutarotase
VRSLITLLLLAWSWEAIEPLPEAREQHACEVCGHHLYVAAGGCQGRHTATMYRYDLIDGGPWVRCADAPSAVQSPCMRAVNGRLYFIGGHDSTRGAAGGKTSTVGEYDPIRDRWALRAPIPTAREDMGSAVLDGEIWIFGGLDNRGHARPRDVEVYSPALNQWRAGALWPRPRCLGDFACADGRDVYLVSGTVTMNGYPRLTPSLAVEMFREGQFVPLPPIPAGHCYAEVESIGGIVYVIAGATEDCRTVTDRIDRFDIGAGRWLSPISMPYGARSVGAAQYRGRLYVTGGWRDGQDLHDAWRLTLTGGTLE